jgi:hypothetical protein
VAVTVSTQRGSALDDQHFIGKTEQLFWADGDMTAKPFVLQTLQTGEAFMAAKNMTVRMAVDRTAGGAARLGTSSVAVTIQDPDLAQTVEAWSAGMGRTGPFTVRAVPVGSWYFDRNGFCRSTPVAARQRAEISFTLTGPGRLAFVPGLIKGGDDDNSTMTATIGREVIPCENGDEIVRYLGRGSHVVRVSHARHDLACGRGGVRLSESVWRADADTLGAFGCRHRSRSGQSQRRCLSGRRSGRERIAAMAR